MYYSRFNFDKENTGNGFQMEYNAVPFFTACGGNFSNSSGIITSPSYPNPYPHMADCDFLVSQPNGTYVNISVADLDINCQGDYLEMRDGKYEDAPLMGKFCGNNSNVPAIMQTTQNFFRVR